MFARLALSAATYPIDKPYDYSVPANLESAIREGMRVIVPFGNGNRISEGVVLSLTGESGYPNCKEILRIVDSVPLLSAEQLQLAYFMRDRYFCTVYQAIRTMLPAGLWLNKSGVPRGRDQFREMVRLSVSADEANQIIESRKKSAPKQAELLELLSTFEALPVQDLLHFTATSRASLLRLEQQELIEHYSLEVYRRPESASVPRTVLPVLNNEQREVLESILEQNAAHSGPAVHLISGVTGSGKTCIYGHLIENCLSDGKSAILLVPEIALTPQILAQFNSWFGEVVALLHSSLTVGERYDEWKRIKRGEARLVIGTRSAVFAPVANLGLVIMDEEQEDSYRSESSPRYNTKEVARFRCHQSHSSLILGSATPDIRSRFFAEQGDYFYHSLPHRFNTKPLPRVQIVDMKEELRAGNRSLFSRSLKDALMDRINRQEQSILFLNRRGTNKLVCCSECGYTYRCPHCSVSMTWHAGQKRLICHYCGSWTTLGSGCPNCGGTLNFIGAGTQLAETELSSCFPGLPILRIDSDTVSPAGSHRILFQRFEEERIPVMIGTQMITKGLNFDRVTLVGVLSADQSLYSSDFRAGERTFSLITQVVGRSGRGEKQGEAFIQTFTPDHEIIQLAAQQDYESFYQRELEMRRLQNAPPFFDWIAFSASGTDEALVLNVLQRCKWMLQNSFSDSESVQVLGPVPMSIVKMNDRFRYRLQICCHNSPRVRQILSSVLTACGKMKESKQVSVYIENDPNP